MKKSLADITCDNRRKITDKAWANFEAQLKANLCESVDERMKITRELHNEMLEAIMLSFDELFDEVLEYRYNNYAIQDEN